MQLVEEFRSAAPWLTEADEPALRACALAAARFEAASGVLVEWDVRNDGESIDEHFRRLESSRTLSRDARGWMNTLLHLAEQLGLTPNGRRAINERDRSLIPAGDVHVLLIALIEAGASFVDAGRSAEYHAEIDAVLTQCIEQEASPPEPKRPVPRRLR